MSITCDPKTITINGKSICKGNIMPEYRTGVNDVIFRRGQPHILSYIFNDKKQYIVVIDIIIDKKQIEDYQRPYCGCSINLPKQCILEYIEFIKEDTIHKVTISEPIMDSIPYNSSCCITSCNTSTMVKLSINCDFPAMYIRIPDNPSWHYSNIIKHKPTIIICQDYVLDSSLNIIDELLYKCNCHVCTDYIECLNNCPKFCKNTEFCKNVLPTKLFGSPDTKFNFIINESIAANGISIHNNTDYEKYRNIPPVFRYRNKYISDTLDIDYKKYVIDIVGKIYPKEYDCYIYRNKLYVTKLPFTKSNMVFPFCKEIFATIKTWETINKVVFVLEYTTDTIPKYIELSADIGDYKKELKMI